MPSPATVTQLKRVEKSNDTEPVMLSVFDMPESQFESLLERRVNNRLTFLSIVKSALKEGVDYCNLPVKGKKALPTLLKGGGEVVCQILGLTPQIEIAESSDQARLGTFHSLCYRMLIMHLKAKFKVISQSRQTSILKQLIESNNVEVEPRKLLTFINTQKDKGLRAIDSNDEFEKLYMAYQTYCKDNLLMDFGDLLLRCYELLSDYPKLLSHYQNKFDFVLVDEAQDTNFIQYEFLKLLTHEKQNMFFIGDDAQSIYGFRGAVLENLFTFQAEYPSHELIKLEQNYRCSKHKYLHKFSKKGQNSK